MTDVTDVTAYPALAEVAASDPAAALASLRSSALGLSAEEAGHRLDDVGPNAIRVHFHRSNVSSCWTIRLSRKANFASMTL